MIEERDFEEVIVPSIASRHTARLLNVLQPLLEKHFQRRMIKKLKLTLDYTMGLAIKIRALSLVGTEDYESIWPLSGSLFDRNEMEMQHDNVDMIVGSVRLPLCPGLRAYPKEKAMVAYHPFGNGEGAGKTPKFVVKAQILA